MSNNTGASNRPAFDFCIGDRARVSPDTSKLSLHGHLDAEGAPQLSEELSSLLDCGTKHVELDFADVRFISSTGIGSLIAAIGEFRDVGGDIVVCGLSDELRGVFEMLDLLDYVNVQ
jgi:anti-anti-sigma factor